MRQIITRITLCQVYFQEEVELAQRCVRLVCKGPLNMCPHKSLFSPCFPAHPSTGAYLTVETMVEFISMNSYQKLPASWRKHWVIMFCPYSSHLVPKVSHWGCWLWRKWEGVVCFTIVLVFQIDYQDQQAWGVPLGTVFWLSGTSWVSCEVLTSWCLLVAYSPRMHYIAQNFKR